MTLVKEDAGINLTHHSLVNATHSVAGSEIVVLTMLQCVKGLLRVLVLANVIQLELTQGLHVSATSLAWNSETAVQTTQKSVVEQLIPVITVY